MITNILCLYCPRHQNIAFLPSKFGDEKKIDILYLPFLPQTDESVNRAMQKFLRNFVDPDCYSSDGLLFEKHKIYSMTHVYLPGQLNRKLVQRTYLASWASSHCQCPVKVEQGTQLKKTSTKNQLKSQSRDCLSNSPQSLVWNSYKLIISNKSQYGEDVVKIAQHLQKNSLTENLNITYNDITSPKINNYNDTRFEQYFQAIGYNQDRVDKLFHKFILTCWPMTRMTLRLFELFCQSLNFSMKGEQFFDVYRCFLSNENDTLGFEDLLQGFAVIEPNLNHSIVRNSYIKKYYNSVTKLTRDKKKISKILLKESKINLTKENGSRTKKNETSKISIKKTNLLTDFQGISLEKKDETFITNLFRATKSPMKLLLGYSLEEKDPQKNGNFAENCQKCKDRTFGLSPCVYTLIGNSLHFPESVPDYDSSQLKLEHRYQLQYVNDQYSIANQVLTILDHFKNFSSSRGDDHMTFYRKSATAYLSPSLIESLIDEANHVLEAEPRVVKVSSPVYVFGDIHGNIEDLFVYRNQFWPMAPHAVSGNFLFLGDYVDRGIFSLECALYLLSMKILCPQHFYLLRGNHEIQQIQKSFTFADELVLKYGARIGNRLLDKVNTAFDRLPFGATIDERIFCVHGGLPYRKTIEELNQEPTVIHEVEGAHKPVWELVWSDPMEHSEREEMGNMFKGTGFVNDGMIPNMKRATSYYFTPDASEPWFKSNHISHLIRAHECFPPRGFKLHHGGKILTVFSTSNYGNQRNNSTCALVNRCRTGTNGWINILTPVIFRDTPPIINIPTEPSTEILHNKTAAR